MVGAFPSVLGPPAEGGRCYLAMTMPVLFGRFLLRFCASVPWDGSSGVTLGDTEWKSASYIGQGRMSEAQGRAGEMTRDVALRIRRYCTGMRTWHCTLDFGVTRMLVSGFTGSLSLRRLPLHVRFAHKCQHPQLS